MAEHRLTFHGHPWHASVECSCGWVKAVGSMPFAMVAARRIGAEHQNSFAAPAAPDPRDQQ